MEERVDSNYPIQPPHLSETQTDVIGDTFYDSNESVEQRPHFPPPPHQRFYNNTDVADDESKNTYIVRIPKNQIYWVPPPEHAQIVENCKKPAQEKKRSTSRPCLCWTCGIFFILVLLSGAIFAIYSLTLSPRNPNVRVTQFTIWHNGKPGSSSKLSKMTNVTYEIALEVTNPNAVNAVALRSGTASLIFKGQVIADGESPPIIQESMGVDVEDVELTGKSSLHLPKEVVDSLKGSKKMTRMTLEHSAKGEIIEEDLGTTIRTVERNDTGQKGLALTLKVNMPLMKKTWLKILNSKVSVKCDVVVKSLANKNAKILADKCEYVD